MNRLQVDKLIMSPVPLEYKLGFQIKIETGFLGLTTKYHLFLPLDSMVVLSAKKEIVSMSPSYIISKSKENHSTRNLSYVANLKGSFSGSQWVLNVPKNTASEEQQPKLFAKYGTSLFGSQALRKMEAYKIDPEYRKKSKYSLIQKIEAKKTQGILSLKTKSPQLINGKFKIDFKGKSKIASSKNFILTDLKGKIESLLLAKQSQDIFYMEVKYPLTVL